MDVSVYSAWAHTHVITRVNVGACVHTYTHVRTHGQGELSQLLLVRVCVRECMYARMHTLTRVDGKFLFLYKFLSLVRLH